MSLLILLGPQHQESNLSDVVSDLSLKGPLAVITAGWQERESEDRELEALLGTKAINLNLYQRGEQIFAEDTDFREAHRTHMSRVKRLQDLYRKRLVHYLDAARNLMRHEDRFAEEVFAPELEDAFEVVRQLDAHHHARIEELHAEFHAEWPLEKRPGIVNHFNELAEVLEQCAGVVVAGGHVAVLLNRLRLLNLGPTLREKHVIAWGAGAMCLGQNVVLFHDSPPQGRGYAEMFEAGLGLYDHVLPLPHADRRLMLDDADRVTLFARRFSTSQCLTLTSGSRITLEDGVLKDSSCVQALGADGLLEEVVL